jgi:uncharacterized protein
MGRAHVAVRIGIVFGAATAIWLFLHWARDAIFGASDYDRGAHVFSAVTAAVLAVPLVVLAWRYLDRVPWPRLRRASPRTVGRLLTAGSVGYLIPAAAAFTIFLIAGSNWNRFVVDDLALLQDLVLGLIPLALGVLVVQALGRWARRPAVRTRSA